MRVPVKLALLLLLGLAALSGMRGPAEAGVAELSLGGFDKAAHVSPLVSPVYHLPRRGRFCRSVRTQCRLDAGHGYRYEACMLRRGCFPHDAHDDFIDYEYRRKGYSCGYWYRECRHNWDYREDVIGCLRYYGCDRYY